MVHDWNETNFDNEGYIAEKLILRVKGGDEEAYTELVRGYWKKVYNWAYNYTREKYLAEDVAQESFTKVFLYLDSLQDVRLFFPWLKRITRNTALTKIKKHSNRLELPLSIVSDQIIKTEYKFSSIHNHSPSMEEQVLLKDAYDSVRGMLGCLSKRERQVFESHFFHDMSTADVSTKYRITISNVYTTLSRAKDKIFKHYVSSTIKKYILKLKEHDRMDKIVLTKPESSFLFQSWTTVANCMHLVTKYTSKDYTFTEVFGLTSQSFRLNLLGDDINIGGPTSYHWETIFNEGASALGMRCKILFTPAVPNQDVNYQLADSYSKSVEAMEERPIQEKLWEALDLIRDSIKRGFPVITFDVFIPEFGIIYGFDDHSRQLHVIDHAQSEGTTLPYENLGRGLLKDLFIMTVEDTFTIDRVSSLKLALSMILRHAEGKDYNPDTKIISGIPAYSHWISAFEKRGIEPTGNSYNINTVSDARKNAHLFLEEVSLWSDDIIGAEAKPVAKEAAKKYHEVASNLEAVCGKFPFPQGGTPNEPEVASVVINHLRMAEKAEKEGVQLLEQLQSIISSKKT